MWLTLKELARMCRIYWVPFAIRAVMLSPSPSIEVTAGADAHKNRPTHEACCCARKPNANDLLSPQLEDAAKDGVLREGVEELNVRLRCLSLHRIFWDCLRRQYGN